MANHKKSITQLLIEKGLFNHNTDDMIYIGISRTITPNWKGWDLIDLKLEKLGLDTLVINNWKTIGKYLKTSGVLNDYLHEYYKESLWDKMQGDKIISQEYANVIFASVIQSSLRTTNKLLKSLFPFITSQEDLIKNINNYYLINSGYLFNIEFLKMKLNRYSKILNRCSKLSDKIIKLISLDIIQINEVLDIRELNNFINIRELFELYNFLEDKNSDTIKLKQLLTNF